MDEKDFDFNYRSLLSSADHLTWLKASKVESKNIVF